MFCTKCGKQIPDGAEFCHECGLSVQAAINTKTATNQDDFIEHEPTTSVSNNQAATSQKSSIRKYVLIGIVAIALLMIFGRSGVESQPQTLEEYNQKNAAYLQNVVEDFFINGNLALQVTNLFGATETIYDVSNNQLQVSTVMKSLDGGDIVQLIESLGLDRIIAQLLTSNDGPDSDIARLVQAIEQKTGIENITVTWAVTDMNGKSYLTVNANKDGTF